MSKLRPYFGKQLHRRDEIRRGGTSPARRRCCWISRRTPRDERQLRIASRCRARSPLPLSSGIRGDDARSARVDFARSRRPSAPRRV